MRFTAITGLFLVVREDKSVHLTETSRRLNGLTWLVGNTPLLAIDFKFRDQKRVIYSKAENLNMTGSIKDRMALHILNRGRPAG
jgi:cysteine synthase